MATSNFTELLSKQRMVDQLVRSQKMHRHEMVEGLLHKQQEAELGAAIQAQSAAELGQILATLPLDQAQTLWRHLPAEREDEVLWELPETRRVELVGDRQPVLSSSRIGIYTLVDGRLNPVTVSHKSDLEGLRPIWVDLVRASRSEMAFIGSHFGVDLPTPMDPTDIEVSARFRVEDNDDVLLHSNFQREVGGDSQSVPVAFVLHQETLFSVREQEIPVFRLQKRLARVQPDYVKDGTDVLLDLYGADVESSADALETTYATLGRVSRLVLNESVSDDQAAATLAQIAEEEDKNGRIRGNILDTQRALNFLIRGRFLSPLQLEDAKQILRNIESLNSHTSFLFDKINFLMDATIGFININQNKRVNQLTVFSVVFMPINILAGIGGMSEFSMMTQSLPWPVAYGAFIVGAVLIGAATYAGLKFFERRRTPVVRVPRR
jgi:magnesium transporter